MKEEKRSVAFAKNVPFICQLYFVFEGFKRVGWKLELRKEKKGTNGFDFASDEII